jgi:signal peptidase I
MTKTTALLCALLLLISVQNARGQNENIDYGNGSVGDISLYEDYKPYINDSLIPFAYNILQKNTLMYRERKISYEPDSDSIIKGYAPNNTLKIKWDSNYNIQKITEKNTRYKIDYLFKKYTDYNEPYPVTLLSLNEFTLDNRKFALLETSYYCNINAINSLTFTFLFEIMGNDIKHIPFRSSEHSSPLCYGDFDNDGNLDYLDLEDCEVTLYSFKNGGVIKNKHYFLALHCIQISPETELIFINTKQSEWGIDFINAWSRLKI